jgi:hypothetical protein
VEFLLQRYHDTARYLDTTLVSLVKARGLGSVFSDIRQRLVRRSGPRSLAFLEDVVEQGYERLQEGRTPGREHVSAAQTLVDRAGFRVKEPQALDAKELSEMSREELAAVVLAGEAELARRAKPVNAAETEPKEADLSDIID